SIRKSIFHEKNVFLTKHFFGLKNYFFHEKSIFRSILQNRMKIRLRWSRGRMERFYLRNRITRNLYHKRGRSNTRRLTGEQQGARRRPPQVSDAALRVPAGGDQVDGLPPDCRSNVLLCLLPTLGRQHLCDVWVLQIGKMILLCTQIL
ncbi:MAG: hypothetical protein VX030_06735, partial [SAR324 cluster bacterium]|nr:hypothetical protein [SAR324 cluster bacterium]